MVAFLANLILILVSIVAVQASYLHVIGIRGEIDDAVLRFERSLQVFGYKHTFADLSTSGRVAYEISFADKVRALQKLVRNLDSEYVLILDGHSSLLLDTPNQLLTEADKFQADFIFIETDRSNGIKLPSTDAIFTGMLAKTKKLNEMLQSLPNDNSSEPVMDKFISALNLELSQGTSKIAIDYGCVLFQSVDMDARTNLKVRYDGDRGYIQNVHRDSVPIILVASPDGKYSLNALSNYLVRAWSPQSGCQICVEEKLDLSRLSKADYPLIQLSTLVTYPVPFLEIFFERLANLTYPKNRINLITFCSVDKQRPIVDKFVAKYTSEYHSTKKLKLPKHARAYDAFLELLSACWENNECNYLFLVEPTVQLKKRDTLEHLVSAKRNAITPLMTRPGRFWSTFWGALGEEGGYSRSDDYFDIVEKRQVGLWNVPLIGGSILFSRWAVEQLKETVEDSGYLLYDISNAAIHRNLFLYVDNRDEFGHLVNPEAYNTTHLHNDLWQIFVNPVDWEERYINPLYHKFANASTVKDFEQPCPDVFWVPLMSETFCKQIIEEIENFGEWSDGTSVDLRLESDYENVPTVDIHMRQIDWEDHWIYVLQKYIYPIQLKLWEGYTDKPTAGMSFVVRYKKGEQPSLKHHHDASTYSIDMALNRAHIDYTGGGVRFPRYNCSLTDTRVGWSLVFPGRLTHYHEAMEVTYGIRYVFVSFINP
ncbi:hypothetical protein Aperf_G00000010635 [Anoplocephala perfoliata]